LLYPVSNRNPSESQSKALERLDSEEANLLEPFLDRGYRDSYLEGYVKGSIAIQIRALREKLGLSQARFARKMGMTQSVISRLENAEYGSVTVSTLLKVAKENKVGLSIRFTDYLNVVHADLSPSALKVDDIVQSYNKCNVPIATSTAIPNSATIFILIRNNTPAANTGVRGNLGVVSWQTRLPPPLALSNRPNSPAFETLNIERSTQT